MAVQCCICDEEFKPGDRVVLPLDARAIVHETRCTFLMPHRYLCSREAEVLKVQFPHII